MTLKTKNVSTFDPLLFKRSIEGDSDAAYDLLSRLANDDPETQSEIIAAIEETETPDLWHLLLEVLARQTWYGNPTPVAKATGEGRRRLEFAIRGLFGDLAETPAQPAKIAALTQALDQRDTTMRYHATLLLGRRGDEAAFPHLVEMLSSANETRAIPAANVLGEMRSSQAAEALVQAVASNLIGLHRAAAQVLEHMGQVAVPALIQALRHSDNHVRWHAARALGKIREPEAIPALLEALEDVDVGVRWLAGEALIGLKDEALEPLLRNLVLKPVNAFLRDSTLHVLSRYRSVELRDTVAPVIEALKRVDYSALGPVAAHKALQELRGR